MIKNTKLTKNKLQLIKISKRNKFITINQIKKASQKIKVNNL